MFYRIRATFPSSKSIKGFQEYYLETSSAPGRTLLASNFLWGNVTTATKFNHEQALDWLKFLAFKNSSWIQLTIERFKLESGEIASVE